MTPALGALLVVDDDEHNRDLLCRRLARKGYAATAAASGQEALALLLQHAFDLVLLDELLVTGPGPGRVGSAVVAVDDLDLAAVDPTGVVGHLGGGRSGYEKKDCKHGEDGDDVRIASATRGKRPRDH